MKASTLASWQFWAVLSAHEDFLAGGMPDCMNVK
jgi:hypothetical protein